MLQVIHPEMIERAASAAASALVAGLWQGIALAIVTAAVLKFLPRTTATARFLIWTVVFAASATMPLLHLATSTQSTGATASAHLQLNPRWSYPLAVLWIATATFRLVMLAVEAFGLRQLWRTAEPIAAEILEQSGLQSATDKRRVEVCTTSDVDRPSVIGFFAPRILIPVWLFAQLSATELRHIVLHELEHLRRRDDWLNLLQKIGLVLFPLNPAMFWIDRRLSTEREIACDDGVLACTNTPRAYASSLTSIAERRLTLNTPRRMVALALGTLGADALLRRRSEFAIRIETILGRRPAGSPALAAAVAAAVIAGAFAMTRTPELVSFAASSSSHDLARTAPIVAPASPYPAKATFRNASFRIPDAAPRPAAHRRSGVASRDSGVASRIRAVATPIAALPPFELSPAAKAIPVNSTQRHQKQQWLVLASFEQQTMRNATEDPNANDPIAGDVVVPVSRILVRTPDGKFFVAPYAAVPTQAGWLIVQL